MGVPKVEKRAEKIFRETMIKKSPNLMKNNQYIQGSQQSTIMTIKTDSRPDT